MGVYLNNSMWALPDNITPLLIHTAAYCVLASGLVFFDRKVFA